MKILYFGSDHFAETILKTLCKSDFTVCSVVTTPDAKRGRGQHSGSTPVKLFAEENNLPCLQPTNLKDATFISQLAEYGADIFVVVSYGKILPKEVLQVPTLYSINIHPSLLPKYRGPSPINYALLNGDAETGFSAIKLNEKIDSGDVFYQEKIAIDPKMDAVALTDFLAHEAASHIVEIIHACEQESVTFYPQDDSESSYARLLKKSDGAIDWTRDVVSIHNQVRALVPWPTAYTHFHGKILKIFSTAMNTDEVIGCTDPGVIVSINKGGSVDVATGSGLLCIHEVQYEGKKRMSAFDWCNGQRIKEGERLG